MKKKILIKILAVVLIILIFYANIMITLADEKSDLENRQNEIQNQISQAEDQISEVKEEMTAAVAQIQELTTKINTYQGEIEELDSKLTELESSITTMQTKLEEAEKNYAARQQLLENRIVAQYEAGETTYLDVILGGGSLWDMISNWQLVSDIAKLDNEMLEQIEADRKEIEIAKSTLETSKMQVENLRSSKASTAQALKNSQSMKEQYVSELSNEEKELNEEIERLNAENKKITQELEALAAKYNDKILNLGSPGTLQRPVKSGVITATMYYSNGSYHGALDYGVPIGTNVYAAAEGVVLSATWRAGGLGNCVILQHANGLRTYYGHGNGEFYVKAGDVVVKGQPIMQSGNTGKSSGPHLHFEVRVSPYNWKYGGGDSRRDPRNYM